MNKERRDYDVFCPKGYDYVKFVMTGTVAYCPLSHAQGCLECEIATKGEAIAAGKQVMKAEK